MANPRVLLSFLILTGSLAAGLIACGDDDDGNAANPEGPSDGGQADVTRPAADASDDGASDAAAPSLGVAAIYAGSSARLDASGVGPAGATFAWTITSAPTGSTATIGDATTATPSFAPDRVGSYVISVAVTVAGVTTTIPGTVNVVDPPVFFFESQVDAGNGLSGATLSVVGALEGDGGKPVSCFARDAGSYANDVAPVAQRQNDVWEAPDAGEPSRIVYAFQTREDGGAHTTLLASTSASTCATAPVKLDELDEATPNGARSIEQPRFAPGGARIVYLRTVPGGTTISTVGFDGTARRDLAPFYAYGDGGAAPDASSSSNGTTRPDWLDESTVVYGQAVTTGWQLVKIADSVGSQPTTIMTCADAFPEALSVLPGGDVLVSFGQQQTVPGPVPMPGYGRRLRRYSIDATTKTCSNPRDLASGQSVGAFALSPDHTKVAFTASSLVNVALIDGGALSAIQPAISGQYLGARWVGAGAHLAWSTGANTFDASAPGEQTVMAVMQQDGGALHQATQPSAERTVAGAGIGICAMGRAYGASGMLFGMVGVLGLRLARRRKR